MKSVLRRLFSTLLAPLESGNGAYKYQHFYRAILLLVSSVFCGLGLSVLYIAPGDNLGYLFPVLVFGGLGICGLIVVLLGKNRAIAKIFGLSQNS
jgi:hypothetical protein